MTCKEVGDVWGVLKYHNLSFEILQCMYFKWSLNSTCVSQNEHVVLLPWPLFCHWSSRKNWNFLLLQSIYWWELRQYGKQLSSKLSGVENEDICFLIEIDWSQESFLAITIWVSLLLWHTCLVPSFNLSEKKRKMPFSCILKSLPNT